MVGNGENCSEFEKFCQSQQDLILESGFDTYLPCIWIIGDSVKVLVLEAELSPHGEEELARAWAGEIDAPHFYLAFRSSNDEIHFCEVVDYCVVQKKILRRAE